MNRERRRNIKAAIDLLERARCLLEDTKDEEQEAFDNLPEGLQTSSRGETMEDNIYTLEESIDALMGVCDELEEI